MSSSVTAANRACVVDHGASGALAMCNEVTEMHAGARRTRPTTGESGAACDVSGSGVEQLIDGGVARVVSDVSVSTVRDDVTVTESADPLINSCVSA